eukprot:GHVP01055405.1.p1 GENE.GHVP01055405.1~~GHVP01055405.1.p1  ORF type:complete len:464 (+),score=76.87 GHVP01055405.1:83-1474(+)
MKIRHIFCSLFCVGFYIYVLCAVRNTPYALATFDTKHLIVSFVVLHLSVICHIVLKEFEEKFPESYTRRFPRLGTIVYPLILSSSVTIKLAFDVKQLVLFNKWRILMIITGVKSLASQGWIVFCSVIRFLQNTALHEKIANVAPEIVKQNLSKLCNATMTRIAMENIQKVTDFLSTNLSQISKIVNLAFDDLQAEQVVETLCLGLMSIICGIIFVRASKTASKLFSKFFLQNYFEKGSRSPSQSPAKPIECVLVIVGLMIINYIRGPNGDNILDFSASNSVLQHIKAVAYFLATDACGFFSPEVKHQNFLIILLCASLVIWADSENRHTIKEPKDSLYDENLYIPILNLEDLPNDQEQEQEMLEQENLEQEMLEQEQLEIGEDVPEGDMSVRTPVTTERDSEPCQSERNDEVSSSTPVVPDNDISVPKPKSRLPKKNSKTGQSAVDVENFQKSNKSGFQFGPL